MSSEIFSFELIIYTNSLVRPMKKGGDADDGVTPAKSARYIGCLVELSCG